MADVHMPVNIDQVKEGVLAGSIRHMKLACVLLRQEEQSPYLSDEQLGKLWIPLCLMLPALARRLLYEDNAEQLRELVWEIFELHPCINTVFEAQAGSDGAHWQNTVRAGEVDALTLRLQRLWDAVVARTLADPIG
jgi:hypothetical protein